jgi:hypothetical protein
MSIWENVKRGRENGGIRENIRSKYLCTAGDEKISFRADQQMDLCFEIVRKFRENFKKFKHPVEMESGPGSRREKLRIFGRQKRSAFDRVRQH